MMKPSALRGLTVAALFCMLPLSAQAGGSLKDEPVSYSAQNWTGMYVGGQVGYGWGTNSYTFTVIPKTTDNEMDGIVGGVTVGGNWQFDSIVFGLEGDVSFSDLNGRRNTSANPVPTTPCLTPGTGCSADVAWFGTLRARLGLAAGNWMPFVTGGLAFGKVKGSADLGACGFTAICGFDDTRFGWTVGGGSEFAFDKNWSAKVEYLYVNLGSPSFTTATVQSDNVDFSVVRAGLNYRF